MTVWDLDANMTSGTAKGKIDIGEFSAMYDLEYHLMDDYMVVTSIEFETVRNIGLLYII